MRAEELRRIPARLRNQFMRTRTGQRLAAPFGAPLAGKKWIFILGCYNSGTTPAERYPSFPPRDRLPARAKGFASPMRCRGPEEFGWNRMWCRCLDQLQTASPAKTWRRGLKESRGSGRFSILQAGPFCWRNPSPTPSGPIFFRPISRRLISSISFATGYAVAEGIRRKANPAKYGNPNLSIELPDCALCRTVARYGSHSDGGQASAWSVSYVSSTRNWRPPPAAAYRPWTDFLGLDPLERWSICIEAGRSTACSPRSAI